MTTLDGSISQTGDGGYVVAFDRHIDRPSGKAWTALTDPRVLAN
jgi:hypothetical protein